jgi:hypothetical protein
MSNTVRKYIALTVIVIALAVSVFGVARAAAGLNLNLRSLVALDDRSTGSPVPTEALEPAQPAELTGAAMPTEVFGDPELQDFPGIDPSEGCDGRSHGGGNP